MGDVEQEVVDEAARCLRETLNAAVDVWPALGEPAGAFDSERGQYSATEYLRLLAGNAPPNGSKIVGLTGRDLFIPMLTFLFGQAQLRGPVALVSVARLRPEFYGLPPDSEVLASRLRKEVLHETGHAFGLIHCSDPGCAMSLSTALQHVDAKEAAYCASCRRMIGRALEGFRKEGR